MKAISSIVCHLFAIFALAHGRYDGCKCTFKDSCWPSDADWKSFNSTLGGALIRGVPPGSVCYPDQANFSPEACELVATQWFNSTWHAANPISVDYPIWSNNSCNPIFPNGTSITGDTTAGSTGCSIGNYPVFVVNVTEPAQVSTAIKWAGERNIRVVVKSTGHSNPGRSIGYGSLSIWTHNLRGIKNIRDYKPNSCSINGTLAAARVAAGHTSAEVIAELKQHNAVIVTGANPDVGVVGWLTGGGHGYLSRSYGMGADNLLEATIVTTDGDIIIANPCINPEIFFAIRGGGGGTFGIVTEVVVRTFPPPKTVAHSFQVTSLLPDTAADFYSFLGFLHRQMQKLKEGGLQGYYYIVGPPTVPTLSFQWTFLAFDKPNGTVEKLMRPIEEYLQARGHLFGYQQNITYADSYLDIYDVSVNEVVAKGGSAYGSRLLSAESLANAEVTADVLRRVGPSTDPSKPNAPVLNPLLVGHMIASPDAPSYYPDIMSMNPAWRKSLIHLIVVSVWPDGIPQALIDNVYKDITHNKTQALRDLSPDTGAYFNEPDSYEPEWQRAFFGENYAALLLIKRTYDPKNILWCRRCVGSEALIEQKDGRLCASVGDTTAVGSGNIMKEMLASHAEL